MKQSSTQRFSIKKRAASFRFAYAGLRSFIKSEHNARVHLAAVIAAAALGVYYKISRTEWVSVCLAAALVFSMEIINTALEKLCDFICPARHDSIKQIKDLCAAAVLVSAVAAFITAMIIFVPKFFG